MDQAYNGEEGLELAQAYDYDLVILDLMLPRKGGMEVLQTLKSRGLRSAILVLTARDGVSDKVKALDSGGDDYLTKPFSIEEFLARVRALLRRGRPQSGAVLRVGDLCLDPASRTVSRQGRKIDLTNKEFALLEYLMRNAGRVVTRTMIAEHVWNIDFDTGTNVIDVYITYLRNKVDKGQSSRLIRTVRGIGYTIGE